MDKIDDLKVDHTMLRSDMICLTETWMASDSETAGLDIPGYILTLNSIGPGKGVATYGHPIPQGFSSFVLKPYVKGVTHSEELGWWSISMVDCVTLFD